MPCLADGFIGCEPLEGLEPAAEIVCGDKVAEMLPELIMALVVVALDGSVLIFPRFGGHAGLADHALLGLFGREIPEG